MSDTIIKVENLSKRYRIGLQEKKADTFAQQLWNNVKAPIENFKRIKSLGNFEQEDASVHWALRDVSFEVKQGEVLGIIGKNGAGKSTLLKILSKITEPTSGRIEMHGRVAALLEVGTGFHPELSGRENIYMNGTILGMTKKEIDRKLDEIIDFSGVEKYIDTPVKFYSSGMRVRLGFSVAAHLEPEILVIDEVLAVGDYEFQKKCLGKMQDVSKNEGRTVLFVSHNMSAVQDLCSKSILLKNGSLERIDFTPSIIQDYLNIRKVDNISFRSNEKPQITKIDLNEHLLISGILEIELEFESPLEIDYPVIGLVVYNQNGIPIFGSNPRFHRRKYTPQPSSFGKIQCRLENLELHSGTYYVSFWLGNKFEDFDFKENALVFDFVSQNNYSQLPSLNLIGNIDKEFNWKFL
jgi:lipopolysaccharide transport system ATP-binding protein